MRLLILGIFLLLIGCQPYVSPIEDRVAEAFPIQINISVPCESLIFTDIEGLPLKSNCDINNPYVVSVQVNVNMERNTTVFAYYKHYNINIEPGDPKFRRGGNQDGA